MYKLKSVIMDEGAVVRAVRRISYEIVEHNHGTNDLVLVGICRRGVPISEMIASNISHNEGVDIPFGKIDITLYRDDISQKSPDPVLNATNIPFDITGKTVILVDDVLYTGRTARAAIDALLAVGRPAKVQLAILIDRGHREFPIRADYIGKNVPTSKQEKIAFKITPFDEQMCVELQENVN